MEKANSCLLKLGNVCTGYRMGFIHVRIGFLALFLDYLLLVVADVSKIAKSTPDPSIPLNGTAVQSLIYRFDIIQFALEMHHSLPFFSNYRSNLDHNRSFSETCISHTNPTIEEKKTNIQNFEPLLYSVQVTLNQSLHQFKSKPFQFNPAKIDQRLTITRN